MSQPKIAKVLKALNKGGRPRVDAGAAKSAIFPIRLSHEERAQITMAAQREGLKDSEWARRVLLRAAVEARASQELTSPDGPRSG